MRVKDDRRVKLTNLPLSVSQMYNITLLFTEFYFDLIRTTQALRKTNMIRAGFDFMITVFETSR
jgi:hypothetical protein